MKKLVAALAIVVGGIAISALIVTKKKELVHSEN